ncbi:hypothetical protein ACFFX1_24285 [Dactylosporangium sucinum]|uniref:Uncharacterized protein n=1 Tax=Dactylosporangium sucinum TaxID=1424081 RepID=A0A917U0G4_9ACTN|nr:hypothetical protein [Dactylosporangium sucinum]GGM44127.1 hypothetical protein GCM10007977_052160 [Dactylosporangium sucinum]
MADHLTTLTFAELEYVLRSIDRAAELEPVRRRLHFQPGVSTDIVAAAGAASLLARGLCRLDGRRVVPGELVAGAATALATGDRGPEAAGWIGDRPVVVHLFTGDGARLAVYPGSYGLFGVELIDPAEPAWAPVLRFVDLCTGETVLIRAAGRGMAVARGADGVWFVSDEADHLDRPEAARRVSRETLVARIVELLAQPVGV